MPERIILYMYKNVQQGSHSPWKLLEFWVFLENSLRMNLSLKSPNISKSFKHIPNLLPSFHFSGKLKIKWLSHYNLFEKSIVSRMDVWKNKEKSLKTPWKFTSKLLENSWKRYVMICGNHGTSTWMKYKHSCWCHSKSAQIVSYFYHFFTLVKDLGRFMIQICPTYNDERCSRHMLIKINIYCQYIIQKLSENMTPFVGWRQLL